MSKEFNKKAKAQHSKGIPQPKKRERRATVVITPDNESKVDIQTGDVSDLEMYKWLSEMAKVFANKLIEDAAEVVGDNPEDQIKYLDQRIEMGGINPS